LVFIDFENLLKYIDRNAPLKSQSIKTIKETILIVLSSAFLGLVVNLFHPKGVKIAHKRPSLKFAPDTVGSEEIHRLQSRSYRRRIDISRGGQQVPFYRY